MVGCDLSRASLRCAAGVYDLLVQADAATRLPFADGSLDAVISSFFWEHIPPGTKPTILAECRRVLRPGGRLVFLYDVETDNPTTRRLKERNGALYRELFLEGDGHVGYESRDENLSTFKAAGFRVLEDAGVEGTPVQSPSVYEKMARERTPASRLLRAGASLGNAPWHHLYVAMLRVLDVSVGRVMPRSWARVVLTVAVMEQPLHG
jgi:SAM-dependent methyltransferase